MGVTYYKLEQRYEGDRTKGCGLTTAEMDENFHFLRGYDIKDAYFEDGILTLERVNCDKIIVEGIPEYIRSIADEKMDGFEPEINLTGSTYNEVTGVLTIMVNGEPYEISGFLTPDYDFKLYVGNGLDGRGTIANPLRVSRVNDTGFLAPVERIIPEGGSLPDTNVSGSRRYLTKEKKSPYGLLYSAEDALKIDAWLQENARGWRLPTIEEWNEMLNALECDDNDRNHDKENPGDGEELGAAAARFLKAEEFDDEPELNNFNALPIFWGQDSRTREDILTAGFWSSTRNDVDGSLAAKDLHQFEDRVVHVNERYNHATLKSIRLVKDVEYNSYEDEEIGGITYKTVPMPAWSQDAGAVYATKLWLAENLRLDIVDGVNPVEPKGRGYYLENDEAYNKTTSDVYVVNMWDPFDKKWIKRELKENDVVIVNSYDESGNSEEVIVQLDENGNQVLIPHFQELRDAIEDVNNRLDEEIANRTAADEALDNKIDELSAGTKNRIDEETANRTSADNALGRRIDEEIANRTSADNALGRRIDRLSEDTFNAISAVSEEMRTAFEDTNASIANLAIQSKNLIDEVRDSVVSLSDSTEGKIDEINNRIETLSDGTDQKIEEINDNLGTIKTKTVDSDNPLISLDENGVISSDFKVEYDSDTKLINFYGKNGKNDEPIAVLDAARFVQDGMIDEVRVGTPTTGINAGVECLIITFNTSAKDDYSKTDIEIPLTTLAEIYTAGDYITIENYRISVVTGEGGVATERELHDLKDEVGQRLEDLDDKVSLLDYKIGVGYTGTPLSIKIEELRDDVAYEIAELAENSGKVDGDIYYNGDKIIRKGETIEDALNTIVNVIVANDGGKTIREIYDKDGHLIIRTGETITQVAEELLRFTENHNESIISKNIPENSDNPIVEAGDTTTDAVEKVINYINNTVTTAVEEMQEKVDDIDERLTAIEEEGSSVKNLEGADEDVELFEESGITKILVKGISNPNPTILDMKRTIYVKFGSEDNNPNNIEVHDYWDETFTFTVPPTPREGQRWFIDTNDSYGVDDGEIILRVGEEYTIDLYGRGATVLIPVRLFNTGGV